MVKALFVYKNCEELVFDNRDFNKSFFSRAKNKSKQSFLNYLALRYLIIKHYEKDIIDIDLKYNKYGKPELGFISFNISTSYNTSLIAISDSDIGVDLERISLREFSKGFLKTVLKDNYENHKDDNRFILREWTRYEAYYKMLGLGITPRKIKRNYENIIISDYIILPDQNEYAYSIARKTMCKPDMEILTSSDIIAFYKKTK